MMSLNQGSRVLQSYNSDVISLMVKILTEMLWIIDDLNSFIWSYNL